MAKIAPFEDFSEEYDDWLVRNKELKAILAYNRDEEKEPVAMLLEWIPRKGTAFSKELKDYLFTEKIIAHE